MNIYENMMVIDLYTLSCGALCKTVLFKISGNAIQSGYLPFHQPRIWTWHEIFANLLNDLYVASACRSGVHTIPKNTIFI